MMVISEAFNFYKSVPSMTLKQFSTYSKFLMETLCKSGWIEDTATFVLHYNKNGRNAKYVSKAWQENYKEGEEQHDYIVLILKINDTWYTWWEEKGFTNVK